MSGLSPFAFYNINTEDMATHWAPSTTFAFSTPLLETPCELDIGNGLNAGYSIHIFATEGGHFNYAEDDIGTPISGTIDHIEVWDNNDPNHKYFTLYCPAGNTDLVNFWTTLENSGSKAALDSLIGNGLMVCGSEDADYAETYGTGGTYDLGNGNDTLTVSYSDTTAYGGAGNDTFVIAKGGLFGLNIDGTGSMTADGAPTETNTVYFTGNGTLTFDTLVGVTNFVFGPSKGGQYIYLTIGEQLPGGGRPVFHVTGSTTANPNEIVIEHAGAGVNLNMAGVVATNFTKYNQAFIFDFSGDTARDVVTGVKNTHNVFELGSANDVAYGQNLSDFFTGGHGNDYFNGRGGVDTAFFDGPRGAFTVVHSTTNPHLVTIHDTRVHSPDGTDTLVNVEWATFTNGHLFIG
jgi:hypothetical protein